MKTKLLKIVLLLSTYLNINAQSLAWAKQLGGVSGDQSHSVAVDASGNVYTTGIFSGTGDFDPGPGTFTLTSFGATDVYISKLDAVGNFVWARQIGGTSSDEGRSISVDALGSVYIGGVFSGVADFDAGVGTYTLNTAGGVDFFISKLDASGNFIWAKQFGSPGQDECFSIVNDGTGNIYTTGFFTGTVDFDPGTSVFNLTSKGSQDGYIFKLDAAANFVWAKQVGGVSSDYSQYVDIDLLGNVIITGYFNSTADFDPSIVTYNLTSGGLFDAFVLKLDFSGNFVWAKSFGGSVFSGQILPYAIATDQFGNIYSTGVFDTPVDFDPSLGTFTLNTSAAFDGDVFLHKLDPNGNFLWVRKFGSLGNYDIGRSLKTDVAGSVFASGEFFGNIDFDPGPSIFNLSAGNSDGFVLKLDASGNFGWANKIGGPAFDYCTSIDLDASGNIYTTGYFAGTVDFDPYASVFTLTTSASSDAFIQKLQPGPLEIKSIFTEQLNINVFPNPNNGLFSINNTIEDGDLIITNSIGEIVFRNPISVGKTDIQLENIPDGIYFIELQGDTKAYRAKIIIN